MPSGDLKCPNCGSCILIPAITYLFKLIIMARFSQENLTQSAYVKHLCKATTTFVMPDCMENFASHQKIFFFLLGPLFFLH
jgi:hypothetical protein